MNRTMCLASFVFLWRAFNVGAATLYVSLQSANPIPPYVTWSTAASAIQDAVDLAGPGDVVRVADGVYSYGGRDGNRVAVTNAIRLESLNGPLATIVEAAGIRCLYLADSTVVSGFTLTGGQSRHGRGGGVYCASDATLTNCILRGNYAFMGGGVYGGTLRNCLITGNSVSGWFYYTFPPQPGYGFGAGAYQSTLYNCTISDNSARVAHGGGVSHCTLYNCTLADNSVAFGTGMWWHDDVGGGANESTLYNCTVIGNSGARRGGGVFNSKLYNSIVYYNSAQEAPNYDLSSTFEYSCTSPLPGHGSGNLSADPQLASSTYLSSGSPCRAAGAMPYVTGTDIDGESWASPPSVGCDEYSEGIITERPRVAIETAFTNLAVGFSVSIRSSIEGRATRSYWDFGDGVTAFNQPFTSHAWSAPGDYLIKLMVFNESAPEGVTTSTAVHVAQGVYYVSRSSLNPQSPYSSWVTAATNIQQAVDAVREAGAQIQVAEGHYIGGVSVDKRLALLAVTGPQSTIIDGATDEDCISLGSGATLSGFTLTNGMLGVRCGTAEVVSNCVIVGNVSSFAAGALGATLYNCSLSNNSSGLDFGCTVYNSTLFNCTLRGNFGRGARSSALYNCAVNDNSGSGASDSTLYNCTVTGNAGGGAFGCHLNNCILYFNSTNNDANYDSYSVLNYCCVAPPPTNGIGNFSSDPELATSSHLSEQSPCRGRGTATCATGLDLDAEPWGDPPSIGCDEYHPGAVTGPLSVSWGATARAVKPGEAVLLRAFVTGRATASVWDFGSGDCVTNEPYLTRKWHAPGDYAVVLRAYNETYPEGVASTGIVQVAVHPVVYVAWANSNPVAPYTSWATAARNIQDAVDAVAPGATVVASNGVYNCGGRYGTRVVVGHGILLRSLNGHEVTVIDGGGVARCAYLAPDAVLSGFTLKNGRADYGGGIQGESASAVVSNSVLSANVAAALGGGAYNATLQNCVLTSNLAESGNGCSSCTLYNCILTGNAGFSDGAFFNCTVVGNVAGVSGSAFNSIIYYNSGQNYSGETTLHSCCTTPLSLGMDGNIAAPPLFMDQERGDFRLREGSPCIDAGTNLVGSAVVPARDPETGEPLRAPYAYPPTDMVGNARFVDGNGDGILAWDMGAYEFNSFPPPQFTTQPQLTTDGWLLNLTGAHYKWVHVQRSSNLKDWLEVWSGFMTTEGAQQITDPYIGPDRMFYRAVVQQ